MIATALVPIFINLISQIQHHNLLTINIVTLVTFSNIVRYLYLPILCLPVLCFL